MRFGNRNRIVASAACALLGAAGHALASGSGENIIIIADPLNAESMYVANYYRAARNVPAENVFYFSPGADDYQAFVAWNLKALETLIAERGIQNQADYIVLMPGSPFYIDAPGLVSDGCSPVRRFSISGAYTTAFVADEVLGGVGSNFSNRYSRNTFSMVRFDSETSYLSGSPSSDPNAQRYYIGAMLGYTGDLGNTLQEILDNIDRSVAADFTRPTGTFYFCETSDQTRSGPRHNTFDNVIAQIELQGGAGSHEFRQMPRTEHDILCVLTGAAVLDIPGANMTILPGAYADHLTSYGAMFDNSNQTKISEWIRKGATASLGTVEEPCNYPGKFTHARSMAYYHQGASMGESIFRALNFTPFQGLLYGDPMCRPFDYPVTVTVQNPPTEPASGIVEITPNGQTDKPGNFVFDYEVVVDNRRMDADFALPLEVNTAQLEDGWHDLRVFGYDSSTVRTVGVWQGELIVNNLGRSAELESVSGTSGDLSTTFVFDARALAGGTGAPVEIRLVQHDRVLAAATGCEATLEVAGVQLGAGVSDIHAEALFADGMRVRSAPIEVSIDYTEGTPSGNVPTVFQSTAWVGDATEAFVTLPYLFDDSTGSLTFEIIDAPTQATIVAGPDEPYRLLRPDGQASGFDVMTYRVTASSGQSEIGRVVLVYDRHPLDTDGNGSFDIEDLYALHASPGDSNLDGLVDGSDFSFLASTLRCGEARDVSNR